MAAPTRCLTPPFALGILMLAIQVPDLAQAQDSVPFPRADRLTIAVHARLLAGSADSVRLEYLVSNASVSEQAGMALVVRALLPLYRVSGPALWWASRATVQDSAAAQWFVVDRRALIPPGGTQAGFRLSGVGVTDIVAYRVQGFHEPPAVEEGAAVQTPPSFWVNSAGDVTVGVIPFPTDSSVGALLARIRTLTDAACGRTWIGVPACNALRGHLDLAQQALAQQDSVGTRTHIQAYRAEAGQLADDGLALLLPNADFILGRLPTGGTAHTLYLTGSGGTANPPTLSLSITAPSGTTA